MNIGDLVYLRPKNLTSDEEEIIGLLVNMKHVGRSKLDGTWSVSYTHLRAHET